jgi:hypothetical protein
LKSQRVIPLYDKNGNPKLTKDFTKTEKNKCVFGMMFGGGIGMTIIKKADTLMAKIDGFWSDWKIFSKQFCHGRQLLETSALAIAVQQFRAENSLLSYESKSHLFVRLLYFCSG